jgi:hypothetical protein
MDGFCEHGNKTSGYIKEEDLLNKPLNYEVSKVQMFHMKPAPVAAL